MSWASNVLASRGDNFVLHIEKIGDGFVEPFGPKMVAGFSVYELHIDAQPVAATLYRALQDIADVQLGYRASVRRWPFL